MVNETVGSENSACAVYPHGNKDDLEEKEVTLVDGPGSCTFLFMDFHTESLPRSKVPNIVRNGSDVYTIPFWY